MISEQNTQWEFKGFSFSYQKFFNVSSESVQLEESMYLPHIIIKLEMNVAQQPTSKHCQIIMHPGIQKGDILMFTLQFVFFTSPVPLEVTWWQRQSFTSYHLFTSAACHLNAT